MKRHKKSRAGFTLIEIMVVVVIIGILATFAIKQISGNADKARVTATNAMMSEVSGAIDLFRLEFAKVPEQLEDLLSAPGYVDAKKYPAEGYIKRSPVDGWGNKFVYRVPGLNGKAYDLISLGGDNKEGGDGFDADLSYFEVKH